MIGSTISSFPISSSTKLTTSNFGLLSIYLIIRSFLCLQQCFLLHFSSQCYHKLFACSLISFWVSCVAFQLGRTTVTNLIMMEILTPSLALVSALIFFLCNLTKEIATVIIRGWWILPSSRMFKFRAIMKVPSPLKLTWYSKLV